MSPLSSMTQASLGKKTQKSPLKELPVVAGAEVEHGWDDQSRQVAKQDFDHYRLQPVWMVRYHCLRDRLEHSERLVGWSSRQEERSRWVQTDQWSPGA